MTSYHLYSDGNYFPRAKKSGFGGYIESPEGQIVVEYTEQIKQAEYAHSFELLGIIRGLQIAKDKGIQNIVSHCDDKHTALRLIEIFEKNINRVSIAAKPELYEQIVQLGKSFKSIKFEYIPRSQNKYADSLSRKYAQMMESNYLKHYEQELDLAQKKFAQNNRSNKRIFFSHESLIRSPNKNNPYLVAPYRNKKVRKISKQEEVKDYHYLYIEAYKEQDKLIHRGFFYKEIPGYELFLKTEKIFDDKIHHIDAFCDFLKDCLEKVDHEKVWIYSNHRGMNSYFEQKEKIPHDKFDNFQSIYEKLDKFKLVFFHHLPFKHQFSPEIEKKEFKKATLDIDLKNVEDVMEQLNRGVLARDQSKCFGNLIRYQLKNYQAFLERELSNSEKEEVIRDTSAHLIQLGYKK